MAINDKLFLLANSFYWLKHKKLNPLSFTFGLSGSENDDNDADQEKYETKATRSQAT